MIFSVSGEPYNPFLARIGIQTDADIVVFAGLGLIFDDYHYFRTQFEEAGVFARTVMFCNLASDPIVERLIVLDMALAFCCRRGEACAGIGYRYDCLCLCRCHEGSRYFYGASTC